jgi:hypothetical protein
MRYTGIEVYPGYSEEQKKNCHVKVDLQNTTKEQVARNPWPKTPSNYSTDNLNINPRNTLPMSQPQTQQTVANIV